LPWQVVYLFFNCQFFLFGSFILQAPVDKTPSRISPPLSASSAHCQTLESSSDEHAILASSQVKYALIVLVKSAGFFAR
jgi:hypothetical protein